MPLTEGQYEKVLEPGKWRIQVPAGREVVGVTLKGMRGRNYPLTCVGKQVFHSRLMKRANGEVSEAAILRGVPSCYLHDGPWLMFWPAPAHTWTVTYDTVPRVK